MRTTLVALFVAAPLAAQPMTFDGTICRMNRAVDRMIIESKAGPRLRVASENADVTYEGIRYDKADLRTGDHVNIAGDREGSQIRATTIDSKVRVVDALTDAIFPNKSLVGRFGVREAK